MVDADMLGLAASQQGGAVCRVTQTGEVGSLPLLLGGNFVSI